jgi:hypothetical protein
MSKNRSKKVLVLCFSLLPSEEENMSAFTILDIPISFALSLNPQKSIFIPQQIIYKSDMKDYKRVFKRHRKWDKEKEKNYSKKNIYILKWKRHSSNCSTKAHKKQ